MGLVILFEGCRICDFKAVNTCGLNLKYKVLGYVGRVSVYVVKKIYMHVHEFIVSRNVYQLNFEKVWVCLDGIFFGVHV